MIRAVVFDVGETLIDESRQWREWADWLCVPCEELFGALTNVIACGQHHHRVFEMLRPGFSLAAAREERRKAGIEDVFKASDLYPDAAPCLRELHLCGFQIGIAGNQPAGIENVFEAVGAPFDFVASSAKWGVEKPSPAFFEKIAEELPFSPASIAYVGDRVDNDVLPALAAGMTTALIQRGLWGTVHAKWPEAAKAHLRLNDLASLGAALKGLALQAERIAERFK
jgi:HAD superfamily hydrolase (TIGR01662 family)